MAAYTNGMPSHSAVANHPLGRARLSCVPCRKRKSKCDEQTPCSSCVLRGTAETCHLPDASAPTPRRTPSGRQQPNHQQSPYSSPRYPLQRDSSYHDENPPPSKRRRPSPGMMRAISSEGVVGSSDLDGSGGEALQQLGELQRGLLSLESTIKRQQKLQRQQQEQTQSSFSWSGGAHSSWPSVPIRSHPNPLPAADQGLIDEILAAFPSQSDCEVLLEFVLQEPDWIVNCISSQWIIPIWSRLVYGARVTRSEAALIAAALAVSSLLLAETPHVYYMTSVAPELIHPPLANFVQGHLEQQHRVPLEEHTDDECPQGLVDDFIALGLAIDYLRFSGSRRTAFWPLVKLTLRRRADHAGLMDEDSPAWRNFDHLETEMARRVVWHVIVCERWGSVYSDFTSPYPLRDEDVRVKKPSWIETSLSAPFRASPVGLDFIAEDGRTPLDCKLDFRSPAKAVPRLFRHKGPEESINAAEISETAIALSAFAPDVSDYIGLIKEWKKGMRSHSGDDTPPDDRREALLHQGVALCEGIKTWQASIDARCAEPSTLDVNDFFACRKANQASIIHTGVRQILDAVLSAWVTQEMVADVSSPLLVKLQKEAYRNARDVVATIDLTRTLLTCGRAIYFGSWAAYTFFNAATTLAIPLLGAKRLREEAVKAEQRLGKIVLKDRYTTLKNDSGVDDAEGAGAISATPALSLDELRTLAPDILRILDLLPIFAVSPLGQEARQRLSMLVETHRIGQGHNEVIGAMNTLPSSNALPLQPAYLGPVGINHIGGSHVSGTWPARRTAQPNAAPTPDIPSSFASLPPPPFGMTPPVLSPVLGGMPSLPSLDMHAHAPLDPTEWRDARGRSILDDLVALDDAWWGEVLAGSQAPQQQTQPQQGVRSGVLQGEEGGGSRS